MKRKVFFTIVSLLFTINFTCGATEVPDSIATAEDGFTELEELVVVERQKLVKSDGATLTYNVSEDPESSYSNILDILKKVPGVMVDSQDNVKVNGQSSFKVLMNGKEDPMLKGDLKTILKSIPASTIRKIEVISEPGAKYDAEGVGGILNIVTDRSKNLTGFMTQFGGWINAYQAGGYVNARTKMNKVLLDANISYNNGKLYPHESFSETVTESLDDSDNHLLTARYGMKSGWDYTGVNLNMSWEPDTLNLFTFSLNYGYNSWFSRGREERDMKNRDLALLWNLYRDYNNSGYYSGVGMQASYQHNFGRDDHNIVASFEYDGGHSNYQSRYDITNITGPATEYPYTSSRNIQNYNYCILQLDYSNRFNAKHLFEAGGKVFLNDNGSNSIPYFGLNAEDAMPDSKLEVKMNQMKNVYALYGSFSGTYAKWNVKAGLRYEHTAMGVRYKVGNYPDYTTHLNDVVPNAAISYNITDASNLRFAYQMRISRPDISVVNPYVNILAPGQISYGNPDLKSEKGHTMSLAYSNYEHKVTGSVKLSYRYVNNGINDVVFMKDGVLNSTYANVGISHIGSMDISANWNINTLFQWSLGLYETYEYLRADSDLLKAKNHGWQTNIWTNLNYSLPSKWRFSANGGFYTPWIDLQGRGKSNGYYYGLGVSRSWLKDDALTVNMGFNNVLPAKRTNRYSQESETVRVNYEGRYSQWNVNFGISFKFGGLQTGVKKTAASIEKESSSTSGSKGN